MVKRNFVQELSFGFSLKMVELYRVLAGQKEYVISKQLLRSGTSIGANIEEALAAQSRKDFISKMSIASKEARETRYWLRLLKESNLVQLNYNDYISISETLMNVLTKIVKTSQENLSSSQSKIQNPKFKI